jgi:Mg2+-importing ATPase
VNGSNGSRAYDRRRHVAVGYSREYTARAAVDALRARVHLRARVLRDGRVGTVDAQAIVPGDVVVSSAGSLVPADALILEATDFFHSEAVLTGESVPVEKQPGSILHRSRSSPASS